MYYCHTRYLVPEWGRWLNVDNPNFLKFDDINGMNLFAYCGNNPVMNVDFAGTVPEWTQWLLFGAAVVVAAVAITVAIATGAGIAMAVAVGSVAAMVSNVVEQGKSNGWDNIDIGKVGIHGLSGALYGLASCVPGGAAMFARAGVSAITSMSLRLYETDGKSSVGDIILHGATSFAMSMAIQKAGGLLGDKFSKIFGKSSNPMWPFMKIGLAQSMGNLAPIVLPKLGKYATDFFGGFFG